MLPFAPSFRQASFRQASFRQASFRQASFRQASFRQASFRQASFRQASFRQASFRQASFRQASFRQASFRQASFRQASFRQASFRQASFRQASFRQASARPARRAPQLTRGWPLGWLLLLAVSFATTLVACSSHYPRAQFLAEEGRWEEAEIEFQLAYLEDPQDPLYLEALTRAKRQVARINLETYRRYLARKAFRRAYWQLTQAVLRDPEWNEAQAELQRWTNVLISGRITLDFETLRQLNLSNVEEIRLLVRLNTPYRGETLDAEIDPTDGIFHVEHVLYNRPVVDYSLYTLNGIGIELRRERDTRFGFIGREFRRFVSYGTPQRVLPLAGQLQAPAEPTSTPLDVLTVLPPATADEFISLPRPQNALWTRSRGEVPRLNPSYHLSLAGRQLSVETKEGTPLFMARWFYVNPQTRRVLIDFGPYHLQQQRLGWEIARQPAAAEDDHLLRLAEQIVLLPYFRQPQAPYRVVSARASVAPKAPPPSTQ